MNLLSDKPAINTERTLFIRKLYRVHIMALYLRPYHIRTKTTLLYFIAFVPRAVVNEYLQI